MKKYLILSISFLIVLALVLSTSPSVNALSCAISDLTQSMDSHDVIVQGTIKSRIDEDNYKLEVKESWKQVTSGEIQVYMDSHWGDRFEIDKEYILFLTKNDNVYEQGLCSLSIINDGENPYEEKSFDEVITELDAKFGSNNLPTRNTDPSYIGLISPLIILAILGLLVLIGWIYFRRKLSKNLKKK